MPQETLTSPTLTSEPDTSSDEAEQPCCPSYSNNDASIISSISIHRVNSHDNELDIPLSICLSTIFNHIIALHNKTWVYTTSIFLASILLLAGPEAVLLLVLLKTSVDLLYILATHFNYNKTFSPNLDETKPAVNQVLDQVLLENPSPDTNKKRVTQTKHFKHTPSKLQTCAAFDNLNLPNANKSILKKKLHHLQSRRTNKVDTSTDDDNSDNEIECILDLPDVLSDKEAAGKLLCDGRVAGIAVEFEIDTGAGVSIIPLSVFKRIDPDIPEKVPTTKTYKDYGGHQINHIGLYLLPIELGNKVRMNHPLLVVDQPNDGTCLLGVDVVKQKRLSIDCDNAQIYLVAHRNNQKRRIQLKDSHSGYVTNTVDIEPGEIASVTLSVDSLVNRISCNPQSHLQGVTVVGKGTSTSSMIVPSEGLYTLDSRGTFEVPIINRTLGNVTLFKGEKLLDLSTLTPGTVIYNQEGQQMIMPNCKPEYTLTYCINELERVLSLKELTPEVRTNKSHQTVHYSYVLDLKIEPGPLLVDEKAIQTKHNSFKITREESNQSKVTGTITPSVSHCTRLLETLYLDNKDRSQLTLNISKVPLLKSSLERAYCQLALLMGVKPKPLNFLILNDHHKRTVKKIKAMNSDEEMESSSGFEEDDLAEDLFQPKKPLNNSPEFWSDLLSSAPPELQHQLLHMLTVTHKDAFPQHAVDFGNCTLPGSDFPINLSSNATFSTKPYPLNHVYQSHIDETVEQMIKAGLLVEGASSYGSGVFVRSRPDQTGAGHRIRLIFDLRKLNSYTIRDNFPLPNIRLLLQTLYGKRHFALLDLKDSYQSIKIKEEDQVKAAIVTANQVLIPKRMSYGFCNAPSHFSRTIARVVGPIKGCVNYMDDIILTGDLAVDLLDTLDKVLDNLKKAGFKINLSKVTLFKKKIKLLGVVFSPAGVSSDPNKIAAITAIPPPTTVTELRRFLGASNFHSEFVPCYADLVEPLLSYISGDSKDSFTLSEPALQAFEALKQALAKPVKLNLIDRNRPTYLETDASYHGYGSCCYQVAYFDKDSVDKLKAWQADIQNRSHEELDLQAKEAIELYIKTGNTPEPPVSKPPNETPPENPFLTSQIKSKTLKNVFFLIQINFYYAKKFSATQQKSYSSLMKELCSVLITIEKKCDLLLLGSQLIVLSDAKPVIYLFHQVSGQAIMSRYLARLSSYPFSILIRHKSGKNLALADTLSRAWVLDPREETPKEKIPYTQGILVETIFTPGQLVTPTDILYHVENATPQLVTNASDPKITKETQTYSETINTINRLVHANPSTTSSATQTGTREGVPNRPKIKLMDNTSRIYRIKSSIMSEVDYLFKYRELLFHTMQRILQDPAAVDNSEQLQEG